MALVTVAELKAVLGIGDLYADEVLEQVIDTASNVILALLQRYGYAVDRLYADTADTIHMRTTEPHDLYVGQNVTLSGLFPSQYNGTAVVAVLVNATEVEVTKAHGQTPLTVDHPLIPAGRIADTAQLAVYDTIPEVREAALAISVDVFQSRVAPGGQMEAVDFTPGPYRLGRSLVSRVQGILAKYVETGTMVG